MVKKKVNEKISYLCNMNPATFCKVLSQTVSWMAKLKQIN